MAEGDTNQTRKLYTLSEISQRTGISMPTLQRYKKLYQNRIPSEGKGRKQRYPDSALPVFDELKNENAARRGRPRKDASAGARGRGRKAAAAPAAAKRGVGRPRKAAAAAKPAAGRRGRGAAAGRKKAAGGRAQRSGNLLTLGQVSEQTGISYPTLVRYVRLHGDRLPSEGTGRSRRFHPEAVDVFRQLRSESGRGGRKPAAAKAAGRGRGRGRAAAASSGADTGTSKRLKALERAQQDLEKRFRGFVQSLQKLFR